MNTALYLGVVNGVDARGEQRLYRLSPPITEVTLDYESETEIDHEHLYVVVSAITVLDGLSETYIFPSDEAGNITSWLELDGSFKGDRNHAEALALAGYTIIGSQEETL